MVFLYTVYSGHLFVLSKKLKLETIIFKSDIKLTIICLSYYFYINLYIKINLLEIVNKKVNVSLL